MLAACASGTGSLLEGYLTLGASRGCLVVSSGFWFVIVFHIEIVETEPSDMEVASPTAMKGQT